MTILRIAGSTLAEYAANAFKFATEQLWGNLSCAVFTPESAEPLVVEKVCGSVVLLCRAFAMVTISTKDSGRKC